MVLYDVLKGLWKNEFRFDSLCHKKEVEIVSLFFKLVVCLCHNSENLTYSLYFFDQSYLRFEEDNLSYSHRL